MCLPQRAFQRSRSAIKNCLIFVHVISSSISVRGQYKKETIIFIQKLIRIFTRIFFLLLSGGKDLCYNYENSRTLFGKAQL